MKRIAMITLALAVVLGLSAVALAGGAKDVTLTGKIACAKCVLKVEGVASCQDVLVVAGKGGAAPTYYYFAKTEAIEEFGHACDGEKAATVTGVVAEKDGKQWIAASKIEEPKG